MYVAINVTSPTRAVSPSRAACFISSAFCLSLGPLSRGEILICDEDDDEDDDDDDDDVEPGSESNTFICTPERKATKSPIDTMPYNMETRSNSFHRQYLR